MTPGEGFQPLPADAGENSLARLDRLRHSAGSTPTAELRDRMQQTMQSNCAVFRTGEILEECGFSAAEIAELRARQVV